VQSFGGALREALGSFVRRTSAEPLAKLRAELLAKPLVELRAELCAELCAEPLVQL